MESWTLPYYEENTEHCQQLLKDRKILEQIPLLNELRECNAYNNKMVRFKGMIQNILDPVYYIEKLEIFNKEKNTILLRSGKYRDTIHLEKNEEILQDSIEKTYKEKYIMHCVEVPGLNSWTKEFKYVNEQSCLLFKDGKRKTDDRQCMNLDMDSKDLELKNCNKKLFVGNATQNHVNTEYNYTLTDACLNNDAPPSLSYVMKDVHTVILNMYDYEDCSLKVNDLIEAIGFLNFNLSCENSDEEEIVYLTHLPTVHVIYFISNTSVFDNILKLHKEYIFENAGNLRDDLWLILTDILMGDTLAADYLLCHLISTIYSHKDTFALGKFSLNLSNIPTKFEEVGYVSSLYTILTHLVEKSLYIPITIPYLNNTVMIPKKINGQNRLITGLLQVSSKTHIVIDETKLEPGTLMDTGIQNVQALSNVINSQKVEYDFEFYKLPFMTDVSVLILSGGKSLLPSDYHIILDPDESCVHSFNESHSRVWKKMIDPVLSKLRVYIGIISSLDYDLTSSMQNVIEDDYVNMRQHLDNNITSDDLHRLLILSR
ncbi:hypothetical protein PGB90_001314 [Kerria lacca]